MTITPSSPARTQHLPFFLNSPLGSSSPLLALIPSSIYHPSTIHPSTHLLRQILTHARDIYCRRGCGIFRPTTIAHPLLLRVRHRSYSLFATPNIQGACRVLGARDFVAFVVINFGFEYGTALGAFGFVVGCCAHFAVVV